MSSASFAASAREVAAATENSSGRFLPPSSQSRLDSVRSLFGPSSLQGRPGLDGRTGGSPTGAMGERDRESSAFSMLRKLIGQRKTDYVSDGPQEEISAALSRMSARTIGSASGVMKESSVQTTKSSANRNRRRMWRFVPDANRRRAFFAMVIYSYYWRAMLIVLTIILLFGAQIQNTVLPPSADEACNAIFMAAFVLFSLDIIIRIDVESNYFVLRFCDYSCSTDFHPTSEAQPTVPSAAGCFNIEVGSFLFWCDVISTLTLLHEISFIDNANFAEKSMFITLDDFGTPVRVREFFL